MDPDGRGGEEDLGGVEGGQTAIRIYCRRKEFIFNSTGKDLFLFHVYGFSVCVHLCTVFVQCSQRPEGIRVHRTRACRLRNSHPGPLKEIQCYQLLSHLSSPRFSHLKQGLKFTPR